MWVSDSLRFMGGYALGSWIQVFYRRVFGISPTTISLWLAVIIPIGGLSASYVGGAISDIWKKRLVSAGAWVLCLCSLTATPFLFATLFSNSYQISFLFLLGEYFFAEMWLGPAITIIQVGIC
jgi:predicted MFS family arabinose efflux permease